MNKLFIILFVLITSLLLLSSCNVDETVDETAEEKHKCEWGEWKTTKEATCEEAGREVRKCKLDETHVDKRDIEPLDHAWAEEWTAGVGGHWHVCTREGCKEKSVLDHVSSGAATSEAAEVCLDCGYVIREKLHFLSNKKVMFIGNSHTFYGGVVQEKAPDVLEQSKRTKDKGFFYQLATQNGAVNLNVTNWTFGNHGFKDLFSHDCQANRACGNGTDHEKYLKDKYYDYVIMQQGSSKDPEIEKWIDHIIAYFKEVNPNVKFVFLVQARAHNDNYFWLSELKNYEKKGMIIADWGDIAYDVYTGATKVPGATEFYNKESFVIAQSDSDGFHPNYLAGYLASLTAYCAITGEKAEGQPYEFCAKSVSFKNFYSLRYKKKESNFIRIFESPSDMKGIQQLVDLYLEEKYYRNEDYGVK